MEPTEKQAPPSLSTPLKKFYVEITGETAEYLEKCNMERSRGRIFNVPEEIDEQLQGEVAFGERIEVLPEGAEHYATYMKEDGSLPVVALLGGGGGKGKTAKGKEVDGFSAVVNGMDAGSVWIYFTTSNALIVWTNRRKVKIVDHMHRSVTNSVEERDFLQTVIERFWKDMLYSMLPTFIVLESEPSTYLMDTVKLHNNQYFYHEHVGGAFSLAGVHIRKELHDNGHKRLAELIGTCRVDFDSLEWNGGPGLIDVVGKEFSDSSDLYNMLSVLTILSDDDNIINEQFGMTARCTKERCGPFSFRGRLKEGESDQPPVYFHYTHCLKTNVDNNNDKETN